MGITASYDLFKDNSVKICAIQTCGKSGQHRIKNEENSASVASFGMKNILSELAYNYDIVSIDKIINYDFALLSITSVVEIENFLSDCNYEEPPKNGCMIIAGGMGCLNIHPLTHIIDIAVFGRAEGQINNILNGERPANVWDRKVDPFFEGEYMIRQSSILLPGEDGIGCPKSCRFCQYTHVRKFIKRSDGGGYAASGHKGYLSEDDWNRLTLKKGGNLSAWDGLSEETRVKVNKGVSNKQIQDKIVNAIKGDLDGTINIKVYNIIGFPWETIESVHTDLDGITDLLSSCDCRGGKVMIMMLFTPFSPEPLTPMENLIVDFTNWREVINSWKPKNGRQRSLYSGRSIEAFILPQIAGPYTLQRRIALNNCRQHNKDRVFGLLKNGKEVNDFYTSVVGEKTKRLNLSLDNGK